MKLLLVAAALLGIAATVLLVRSRTTDRTGSRPPQTSGAAERASDPPPGPEQDIIFREATAADMPGILRVRTSVSENALTVEQLADRGITPESTAASFLEGSKGWVAQQGDEIVGFSIADRAANSIVALFVLPTHEGRRIGVRLLDLAVNWLWEGGAARLSLTTDPASKAARFYQARGWIPTGILERGGMKYELSR